MADALLTQSAANRFRSFSLNNVRQLNTLLLLKNPDEEMSELYDNSDVPADFDFKRRINYGYGQRIESI